MEKVVWYPRISIKVRFVGLTKTIEYFDTWLREACKLK